MCSQNQEYGPQMFPAVLETLVQWLRNKESFFLSTSKRYFGSSSLEMFQKDLSQMMY